MRATPAPVPAADLPDADRASLKALASRIDPLDAGAQNNLGVVYFHRGLLEDAIQRFQSALELDPHLVVARRNLEIAYSRSGHYDRRIAALTERIRRDPDDRGARHELARVHLALQRYDAAAAELQALLGPGDGDDAAVLVDLAHAEQARGHVRAAREWLERACAAPPPLAEAHRRLGSLLHGDGDAEGAAAHLARAAELAPQDPEVHAALAFALGDLGRHDEAKRATRRSLELASPTGRPSGMLALGAEAQVPEPAGADEEHGSASAALAHFNLGLAFRRRGGHLEALREFRLALEEGDDPTLVLPAIALQHLLHGDHEAGLELYDQLVVDQPEVAAIWNERGVVLHQLGRFEEALASYRQAARRDPRHAESRSNRGVALAQLGRDREAMEPTISLTRSASWNQSVATSKT